ncbi:DUF4280 domain-containing protein [Flavobacterium gelidilacus]|uniref:DUF4280 domain-containing protein n=1 Tax=Flavobacterium gelidilacus TaxID=206041 RepID=UPI0003F85D43|nr:DUF4280 domain-containing protein [Flavobacterium gelidilacus]
MAKPDNNAKREERQEEEKADKKLLLVIDGAKLECKLCTNPLGLLKVNFDTPTTQGKKTATVKEKDKKSLIFMGTCTKSPNSASPCAAVMQLGEWKDTGTVLIQDQKPLLQQSTIMCNYGGTEIKITDSGQINIPEAMNINGAPVPETEKTLTNGHFYNEDGTFEGKVDVKTNNGSVNDVYTCTGKSKEKNKEGKEIDVYNGIVLLKENDVNITKSDFNYIAYVVMNESGETDFKELKCIAYTSYNRAKKTSVKWKKLLSTTYSSVPNKKELTTSSNNEKSKLTRKALFYVLNGENDLTKGAEFWDGTDFLAWGNSETNPYNKLGQNKFDEYKFIEIPKDIYDSFLSANGASARYGDKSNHDKKNDSGNHEHIKKKIKKKITDADGKFVLDKNGKPTFEEVEVPSKIKYKIPASDFEDQNYWTSGSFYYETGVTTAYGISGTINAGKSIFWKRTKTRLTSETSIKK